MKCTSATILLLVILHNAFAQHTLPYRAIDSVALAIPAYSTKTTTGIAKYINAHFTTEEDKIRAAFIWVASTFTYDVPNMNNPKPNETPQDKINKILVSHKGICENYAAVFNDICNKLGISSYFITGYTRKYGQTSFLPHAWCCTRVNGHWQLYDPTWASGYVQNNIFTPKINEAFYNVPPSVMISSHIPFDPMWELLNYPVTNQEFKDSIVAENKQKPFFNYVDSIAVWQQQNEEQKLIATAGRIQENGLATQLVKDELNRTKMNLAFINSNRYNASIIEFNKAVKFLNTFITYRNHQFTPAKPDNAIQAMLDSSDKQLTLALTIIAGVRQEGNIDEKVLDAYQKLRTDFIAKLDVQKAFLTKYLESNKETRKSMFFEEQY